MNADPKIPGKVLAAVEGIQFDEFGETLIKTAESARDVIPDLADIEVLSGLQSASKGLGGLSIPTSFADMPDIAKELSGEINLTKQKFDDVINQSLGGLTTSAATLAPLMESKSVEVLGQLRKAIPQIPELPNINLQDQLGELLSGKLGGLDVASQLSSIKDTFGSALTDKGLDLDNLVDTLTFAANPDVLTQLGDMDTLIDNMKSKVENLGKPTSEVIEPIAEIFNLPAPDNEEDFEHYGGEMTEFVFNLEASTKFLDNIEIPSINKEALKSLKDGLTSQVGQLERLKNKLSGLVGKGGGDITDMISKVVPNLQVLPNGDIVEKAKKSLLAAVDSVQEQATELNLNANITLITKKLENNIAAFTAGEGKGKIVFDDFAKKVKLELSDATEQLSKLDIPKDLDKVMSQVTEQMKSVDGEILKFSQALAENAPTLRKNVQEQVNNIPVELKGLFSAGQKTPLDLSALSGLGDASKLLEGAIGKLQPQIDQGLTGLKKGII
jgi:hypothetical protein